MPISGDNAVLDEREEELEVRLPASVERKSVGVLDGA
jgi:hypothetical protein